MNAANSLLKEWQLKIEPGFQIKLNAICSLGNGLHLSCLLYSSQVDKHFTMDNEGPQSKRIKLSLEPTVDKAPIDITDQGVETYKE